MGASSRWRAATSACCRTCTRRHKNIFKNGKWTLEELRQTVPAQLMNGVVNPAPPPADLSVPGRPV